MRLQVPGTYRLELLRTEEELGQEPQHLGNATPSSCAQGLYTLSGQF